VARQRDRLYDAEDELADRSGWYTSVEGIQFDVDRFIRGKWWRDRSPVTRVDIEYPVRESGAICITDSHWKIVFSPRSACGINIAHELTHAFVGATSGMSVEDHEQDHSAHFAGAELEIVKRLIGAQVAKELRRWFDEFDVMYVLLPSTPPVNLVVQDEFEVAE